MSETVVEKTKAKGRALVTETLEAAAAKETGVRIPPINLTRAAITIESLSPLMVQKFSEKAKRDMEDKTQGKSRNKKPPRDPEAEYLASLYEIPGKPGVYGVPASGLKNCAVSACRFVDGIPMTVARGAFHIVADSHGLLEITGPDGKPAQPRMSEMIVRIGPVGKKVAQVRYRGVFDQWSITFTVVYNASMLTAEQLANLFENAGFGVGICEYRPEKNGSYGMFRVKRG